MRFLTCVVFSFLLLATALQPGFASTFETQYELTYDIADDGRTAVVMDVGLTNQSTNVFAQHYILTVNNQHIDNVVATSSEGPLAVSVKEEGTSTEVIVTFYSKSIGKGSTKAFRLTYDTSDLVVHKGETWEIAIPPVTIADSISSYKVNLLVPKSFGSFHRFSPEIQSQTESTYTWNFQGTAGSTIYGTLSEEKLSVVPSIPYTPIPTIQKKTQAQSFSYIPILTGLTGLISALGVLLLVKKHALPTRV